MSRFTCPCGREYEIRQVGEFGEVTTRRQRAARRKAERRTFNGYSFSVGALTDQPGVPELQAGEVYKTRTPMRAQDIEADVAVPILQAFAYGAGASLVSILPTVLFHWPWYVPPLVLPTVTGGAIFVTSQGARKLLMRIEEWTGVDINQDGKIGPITEPIPVDLTKRQGQSGGRQTQHLEIPCPAVGEEALARWFWRICREGGQGFSYRVGMSKAYGLSRPEVKAIHDYFIHVGHAEHKGNRIVLNDDGMAVMWGIVTRYYPHAHLSPDDVRDA